MPKTRPVSDLRNHFTDILQLVRKDIEPVFLTEDGREDMVVMSMEAFEKINLDNEIYTKLKEAEIEARTTDVRYSHEEVMNELRADIASYAGEMNV